MKFLYLLGIVIVAESCIHKQARTPAVPKAELLYSRQIDYPSGSTLNFKNDSLFLMGDDASAILVLDTNFNSLQSIPIFGKSKRIQKPTKPDIEASDFIKTSQSNLLWLFGSGSRSPFRDSLFLYDMDKGTIVRASLDYLYQQIKKKGVKNLNIEGAVFIGDMILLGNRATIKEKQNYLVVVPAQSLLKKADTNFRLLPIDLNIRSVGISGMAYDEQKDVLFATLSQEEAADAYQDGKIGDSFLVIVNNISEMLKGDAIRPDLSIPLSTISKSLSKMKIESIALGKENEGDRIVYLVADNDDGKTVLFKIKFIDKPF